MSNAIPNGPVTGRPIKEVRSKVPHAPVHLVDLLGLEREWVLHVFEETERLRMARGTKNAPRPLTGKTAALIFHKPSLRTRVSFTVGMHDLGGDVAGLTAAEVSENGRESIPDVARALSTMCSLVVIRTFAHRLVQQLAAHATIPVINALTDFSHPCQVLADLYTLKRAGRDLDKITIAWVGDGNNVLHSWLQAATLFGFRLNLAVPDGFEPDGGLYIGAERSSKGGVHRTRDPREAVAGADVVYTDTWTSMGQEKDAEWRRVVFAGYQVNEELLSLAAPDALFMHCLPAHRGEEVTDAVIDGPQSIVMEQAENRLHLQKGLMAELVQASEAVRRGAAKKARVAAGASGHAVPVVAE